MRKTFLACSAAILFLGMTSQSSHAWSEQNCNNTCAEQMPGQEAACRVKFNCAQHRGKPHVAGVQAERAAAAAWAKKQNNGPSIYKNQ
jgi:hypothetical protein